MAAPTGVKMFGIMFAQNSTRMLVRCQSAPLLNYTPVMYIRVKHRDVKWRQRRREKVLWIDRQDPNKEKQDNLKSFDERRKQQKKKGEPPMRTFDPREITIDNTAQVFSPYVPPEGDGKTSMLSIDGVKDYFEAITNNARTQYYARRKVKKHEENFNMKELAFDLQNVYIEAQSLLMDVKKNEHKLHDRVTPLAYPKMTFGLDKKTLHWEFVESIEPPKTVSVQANEAFLKDNLFAQVTVRFHTRQKLAMYDRFGRLMYGNPHLVKDVLEYVVFEKHIINVYGKWRIHDKILPKWHPQREPVRKTIRKSAPPPVQEDGSSAVAELESHGVLAKKEA